MRACVLARVCLFVCVSEVLVCDRTARLHTSNYTVINNALYLLRRSQLRRVWLRNA